MLFIRTENRMQLVGTCITNGTMLQWPDQLLLAAENGHFEGRTNQCGTSERGSKTEYTLPPAFLRIQMHATFNVTVLRRQEELVGPSQHGTIRNTCSHELPAILGANKQH